LAEIRDLGDLVADVVDRLVTGRLQVGFMAPIRRGSAAGTLAVVPDPDEHGTNMLLVQLRIVRDAGGRHPGFYRRLLELNQAMNGKAAFSVDDEGVVLLMAGRPLTDLDPGEAIDLILWTADRADHFDDLLLGEFGAEYRL